MLYYMYSFLSWILISLVGKQMGFWISLVGKLISNELIRINTYNLLSIQVRGRISTALFYSRQVNFIPKIFYTFGQCVIAENLYNPGVFYISRKSALAARGGMCSTLTYHSNFNLPTTSLNHQNPTPKYPKIVRELLRRTFEKSFISNNFQLPKNPSIPSNHPKIPLQIHKIPSKINPFSNKNQ